MRLPRFTQRMSEKILDYKKGQFCVCPLYLNDLKGLKFVFRRNLAEIHPVLSSFIRKI